MLEAIGWAVLGVIVGGCCGALAVALLASKQAGRIVDLERSNARLLGDVATAAVRTVELERDLAAAIRDRDNWHRQAMNPGDAFAGVCDKI